MTAIGSKVRPALQANLNNVTPQPVINWGRVTANPGAGTNDVLFDNGNLAEDVPDAMLDVVTDPSDTLRDQFINRVVRPIQTSSLIVSQEYTGKVIDVIHVAFGGSGGQDDRVVMQLLNQEAAFIELPTSLVEVLSDR